MNRSAAAKATAAADALLAWLRDQPAPVFPPSRHGAPNAVSAAPRPGVDNASPDAYAAAHPAAYAGADAALAAGPAPVARSPESAAHTGDDANPVPGPAAPSAIADDAGGAPLRLAHTDWLHHRLTVTGPVAELAAFQAAAAGAGVIPWQLDPDRLAEDFLHLLIAPPPPHQRSLSVAGARILAGQLRDAVARRHDLAVARVGQSKACPFDLHALVPVPETILRRGPDDPFSLAWLWQHWGTTRELRHVAEDPPTTRSGSAGPQRAGREKCRSVSGRPTGRPAGR
jgi:hypothetical protein